MSDKNVKLKDLQTGDYILPYTKASLVEGCMQYEEVFSITATLTNCTGNIPNNISSGEIVNISIVASSGYGLPDNITVTGASYTWNKNTGALTLSNATDDVNLVISAASAGDTWVFNDHLNAPSAMIQAQLNFIWGTTQCEYMQVQNNNGVASLIYTYIDEYSEECAEIVYGQDDDVWEYESAKTIVITSEIPANLLTWLQANATKQ